MGPNIKTPGLCIALYSFTQIYLLQEEDSRTIPGFLPPVNSCAQGKILVLKETIVIVWRLSVWLNVWLGV